MKYIAYHKNSENGKESREKSGLSVKSTIIYILYKLNYKIDYVCTYSIKIGFPGAIY